MLSDWRMLSSADCLSRVFVRWTGRIFWKGYHHTLDEADVYDVLPQDSTVKLSNNLGRYVFTFFSQNTLGPASKSPGLTVSC